MTSRLYYGWVQVIALGISAVVSYGVLWYSFSVLIDPINHEMGWTRTQIAGAYTLATIIGAVAGYGLGSWLDAHGPRLMMTVGACLAVGMVLLWAQVQTLPAFYIVWALLGAVRMMVLYDPSFWVVANWFVRRRRQALTLLTFLGGFSTIIFTPLTQALVQTYGWRAALGYLALTLGAITIPLHGFILRRRPADYGLLPDGDTRLPTEAPSTPIQVEGLTQAQALRSWDFWLLTASFLLIALGVGMVIIYLVPYLTSSGYDPTFAATVAGALGAFSLPGRIIFTLSGARWSPGCIAALIFGSQAVSLGILALAGNESVIWIAIALFGLGYGANVPTQAALIAERFGPQAYGAIRGTQGLFVTVVSAFAPLLAGFISDQTGNLTGLMSVLAGCAGVAAVLVLLGTRRVVTTAR
jgi:sugar phosphate permease